MTVLVDNKATMNPGARGTIATGDGEWWNDLPTFLCCYHYLDSIQATQGRINLIGGSG